MPKPDSDTVRIQSRDGLHHPFNQLQPTVFIDAVPALRRGPSAELRFDKGRRRARVAQAASIALAAAAGMVLALVHPSGVQKKGARTGLASLAKSAEMAPGGSRELPRL